MQKWRDAGTGKSDSRRLHSRQYEVINCNQVLIKTQEDLPIPTHATHVSK